MSHGSLAPLILLDFSSAWKARVLRERRGSHGDSHRGKIRGNEETEKERGFARDFKTRHVATVQQSFLCSTVPPALARTFRTPFQ